VLRKKLDRSGSIDYVDEDENHASNLSRLPSRGLKLQSSTELHSTIKEDSLDSCSTASDATIMEYEDSPLCNTEITLAKAITEDDSPNNVLCKYEATLMLKCPVNNAHGGKYEHTSMAGAVVRREDDCVLTSVQNKDSFGILSDETIDCCEQERLLDPTVVTNLQADPFKNCVNCKVVRTEISCRTNVVVEDKIGFEAEALSAATGQWDKDCSAVERRCPLKVKRVHNEVRRLFIDENTPGAKRELRSFRRRFGTSGNDRPKNRHKLPLRSHAVRRVSTGSCRLSRLRVSCKKMSDSEKLN